MTDEQLRAKLLIMGLVPDRRKESIGRVDYDIRVGDHIYGYVATQCTSGDGGYDRWMGNNTFVVRDRDEAEYIYKGDNTQKCWEAAQELVDRYL